MARTTYENPDRSSKPTVQTTIGVVSETAYLRECVVRWLAQRSHTIAVDLGSGDKDTMDRVARLQPQAVLLDGLRPDTTDLIRRISRSSPDTRVVALNVPENEKVVLALAESGAAGFVQRGGTLDDVLATIERALRSELACSPKMAAALATRLATLSAAAGPRKPEVELTGRERQVIRMFNEGLSNKEIAERLGIGSGTVKTHVHHILEKLDVHKRAEAVATMERSSSELKLVHGRRRSME